MCIIAVSKAGTPQPDEATLRRMFANNPHGAGYMVARGGAVEISKGFMTWADFIHAVRYEKFTPDDSVVYHFRISTQAGVNPQMTHPFPLSHDLADMERIDCACPIGVAHNGIIQLTTDPSQKRYSDTALFISKFLSRIVRDRLDLYDPVILSGIEKLIGWSRLAIMDASGYVATVGEFITDDNGIMYSNGGFREPPTRSKRRENYTCIRGFFDDEPFDI